MDRQLAINAIRKKLKDSRFNHSIRVYETAMKLNEIYNVDEEKLALASILHDYAKNLSISEMKQILERAGCYEKELTYNSEVWHSYAGAELVKRDLGITDSDILQAISFHTTGHYSMTLLDKLVYLADYIEPARDFPGVEDVRELVLIDIDKAMQKALCITINFLMQRKIPIAIHTIEIYNKLVKK
ncbi:MAG: hypothetical protein K0S34_1307 [Bacillales bacterium]|jgi:predicted HD superfamily hydrolase involved in NAD metabolism|nr:hypothetical protein [Bacillales bacterium]